MSGRILMADFWHPTNDALLELLKGELVSQLRLSGVEIGESL